MRPLRIFFRHLPTNHRPLVRLANRQHEFTQMRYYPNIAQNSRLLNPNTVECPILTGTAPTHRFHVFIHHPLPPWLYPSKPNDVNVSSHLEIVDRDPMAGNLRKRAASEPEIDVKKVPMVQVLRVENAPKLLREVQLRVARIGGVVNFCLQWWSGNMGWQSRYWQIPCCGFRCATPEEHLRWLLWSWPPRQGHGHPGSTLCALQYSVRSLHSGTGRRPPRGRHSILFRPRHGISTGFSTHSTSSGETETVPKFILVCTHAARDYRCGTTGKDVAETLTKDVQRQESSERWEVFEIGHVSGHKYVQSYA